MSGLKRRLDRLETQAKYGQQEHCRHMQDFQQAVGLPLPDGVPESVMNEAERRILQLQADIRAEPDHDRRCQFVERFRDWVLSIHAQYGGPTNEIG